MKSKYYFKLPPEGNFLFFYVRPSVMIWRFSQTEVLNRPVSYCPRYIYYFCTGGTDNRLNIVATDTGTEHATPIINARDPH